MARGDSTIKVNIIGDAKSLQGALQKSEGSVKRFDGKMAALGAGIVAAFSVDAIVDFTKTALAEGDRVGDAIGGLERQLGGDLARELDERADDFAKLGASRGDILEMERAFADTATALGQGKGDIGVWAEEAAAIASAFALGKDIDPSEVIRLIGLAAGGSKKPLRELGIELDEAEVEARALKDTGKKNADALTDQEKAAARYKEILEKLNPVLVDATEGTGDFEQKGKELEARWETLTGRIGEGLDGPLTALLDWIISGVEGLGLFADRVTLVIDNIDKLAEPVGTAADALRMLIDLLQTALGLQGDLTGQRANFGGGGFPSGGSNGGANSGPSGSGPGGRAPLSVTIQGGNPADVENAVRAAIKGYATKNGKWFPLE